MALDDIKAITPRLPQNLHCMAVPLVNEEIRTTLSHSAKSSDLRLLHLQENMQSVAINLGKTVDELLIRCPNDPELKKLVTSNLQSMSLLGHSFNNVTQLCRYRLKNKIHNQDYKKLCDMSYEGEGTGLLFGQDFEKSMERAKKASQIARAIRPPQSQKAFSFGGGNSRQQTGSSTITRPQQSKQVFREAMKPTKPPNQTSFSNSRWTTPRGRGGRSSYRRKKFY